MRTNQKIKAIFFFGIIFSAVSIFAQTPRNITIITEPNAIIWINEARFGKTDTEGKLAVNILGAGVKVIRVRADGFKETTQNLPPTQKGIVKIPLDKTTDQAELTFQQAEKMSSVNREEAIKLYKKAISLRPRYAEAYLGLARVLSDNGDLDEALQAVKDARKLRPAWAEASAVEGRIYKAEGEDEKAVAAFRRAITEGKGVQAEASTGLGMIYREKAESLGGAGDFEGEKEHYLRAAAELKKAAVQLAGSADGIVIYQLLGDCYERAKMYKEAIAVYEEFLRIYPNTSEAVTVRSFITQIKKQMSEQ